MKINHSVDDTNLKELFESDSVPKIDIKNEVMNNIDNKKMRKPFKLSLCSFLILLMLGTVSAAAIGNGTLHELMIKAFNNRTSSNSNITRFEKNNENDYTYIETLPHPFEYNTIDDMEKDIGLKINLPEKIHENFVFTKGLIAYDSISSNESEEYSGKIIEIPADKSTPTTYSLMYKNNEAELWIAFSLFMESDYLNSSKSFSFITKDNNISFIAKESKESNSPKSKDNYNKYTLDLNKDNIAIPTELKPYLQILRNYNGKFVYFKHLDDEIGHKYIDGKIKNYNVKGSRSLVNDQGTIWISVNDKCTLSKDELMKIMNNLIDQYGK